MGLSGIFAGASVVGGASGGQTKQLPPPSGISAGFDAIVQCSLALLQQSLAYSLGQRGLTKISLRVPYHPELVTPGVQAAIQPHIRPTDILQGGVSLEFLLQDPVLQTLRWPGPGDVGSGPGGGAGTKVDAIVGKPGRSVDLAWTVQLNLFKPVPGSGDATDQRTPPSPTASRLGSVGTGSTGSAGQSSAFGGVHLPLGFRFTVAQGTATMTVPAELLITAPVYQFRLALNFEETRPTYISNDPILAEFLKTNYAASLLAQTITPLVNQADISLSPTIALAGGLTTSQLAAQHAPALQVQDLLVPDGNSQALALCVSLGADTGGTLQLVRSFLTGSHFAYYVSDKVFVPVLKGLWRANAVRTPLVSVVDVEMAVSQGSDETGTGHARVQVNLIDTLLDVSLQPSTDSSIGDPLLLMSRQIVQLMALEDPSGNLVKDLGSLGEPAVEPLPLGLALFDNLPPGAQQQVQPALLQLIAALLMPIYAPIVEPLAITDVTGYSSSPLHALVVRWNLQLATVGGVGHQVGAV